MRSPKRVVFLLLIGGVLTAARIARAEGSFTLYDPGTEAVVDYEKYGVFTNVGTAQFRYLIRDREGLSRAVGEGIYPNVTALLKDPAFVQARYNGNLEGPVWNYVNTEDSQLNFFKWASSHEPLGTRQFYTGEMLERAGLLTQAIKAYYACVVNDPKAIGSTFWKTPWYVGPTALDRVAYLTREHPELGMYLKGGRVRIHNRFDDNPNNDIFEVDPGQLILLTPNLARRKHVDVRSLTIKRRLGHGKVSLVQYSNNHWQLIVDSQPYIVRGIAYSATPVGRSPDNGTLTVHRDWMVADDNKNGKIDGPYESWVDKNDNNKQDADEPVVGDFQLMKDMGVNTVRLYHHGYNKTLLKDLYTTYGIRVIMGDYAGAYAIGSGADWYTGTDYSNPDQQKKMLDSIREMVLDYKDEPYIVYWVLGNENNYGNANNSRQNPKAYYEFIDRAAQLIKSLDANHPVALCNGDVLFLDKAAQYCPHVDIYGANAYRGSHGFGDSFWKDIADEWGKPVFISEFGCPAYHHHRSEAEAEVMQADYLKSNWLDIEYNAAGSQGVGNAIGGVLFEWLDEWWKAGPPPQYDPNIHDIVGQFGGPFPDGWSYEEWYGVTSQGDGKNSPYLRHLRKSYFMFKDELWNSQKIAERNAPTL